MRTCADLLDRPGYQRRLTSWQPIESALRPAVFDHDVLALDVAGLLQALAECAQAVREWVGRQRVQKPDRGLRRLLRARRHRPRSCCAAQCEYEFSPSDVDCHATPPAGGCVHATKGKIITRTMLLRYESREPPCAGGQHRSFGNVGLMSGLPGRRHRRAIL